MKRITILLGVLAALMLVPAAQALAASTATVTIQGSGSGEVFPAGEEGGETYYPGSPPIECSYEAPGPATGTCEAELSEAEGYAVLRLTGSVAPGSEFVNFEAEGGPVGACTAESGGGPECLVYSFGGDAFTITATLCLEGQTEEECLAKGGEPEQPLTTHIYQGEGTIVSNPAGLECTGSAGKECTAEFAENEEVTLTSSPAAGYRTWYWENCPSPEGHKCTVTMDEAKDVGVLFLRQYEVNISKSAGSEPGLVLLYPAPNGVGCDYNCTDATYNYPEGEAVTLAAYEYPGNHLHLKEFTGGTGDAAVCNGETECSFSVTGENSGVEAVFVKDAQNTLSIEKQGGGLAFIKSYNGIYCSDYCSGSSADYYAGEEVEVSWKLAAGTSSIDWGTGAGTCTGSSEEAEGSCSVTMSAAKELTATLE